MKTGSKYLTTGGGLTIRVTACAEGEEALIAVEIEGDGVFLDNTEAVWLSRVIDAAREQSRLGWTPEAPPEDEEAE